VDPFCLDTSTLLNNTRFCGLANQLLVGEEMIQSLEIFSMWELGFLDHTLATAIHISVGHEVPQTFTF